MRKRRERKQWSPPKAEDDDEHEGGDEWLLTYGDLMTQLVCFFVLLMSFSIISEMKFRDVVASLQEALTGSDALPAGEAPSVDVDVEALLGLRTKDAMDEKLIDLKSEIQGILGKKQMSSLVDLEIREEGLVIILKQQDPPVFFDSADARVKERAYPILDELGKIIMQIPNKISIAGHTDSRPIKTPLFPSNWELSTMRATNVLRHLQRVTDSPPGRFSVAGYGPYRPIAPNNTEAGMAKNRRVEVIILRTPKESD